MLNTTMLHVRFNGRSEDLDMRTLELRANATDAELRTALARRYECSVEEMQQYVIVREPQAIIIRPIAFYG